MVKAYLSEMLPLITLFSSQVRRTLASKIKDILYCNSSNNSGIFHRNNLMSKENSTITDSCKEYQHQEQICHNGNFYSTMRSRTASESMRREEITLFISVTALIKGKKNSHQ